MDEISNKIDERITKKVLELINEFIIRDNNVLLTSRDTFLGEETERKLIKSNDLIRIKNFSNIQIMDLVKKKIKDNKKQNNIIDLLKKPEIKELSERPLLLNAIIENFEEVIKYSTINEAGFSK